MAREGRIVISKETALDTLRRYNIDETQINQWQHALGIQLPTDDFDNPQFTRQHIQLFKNVKRYLGNGYSLADIKKMIVLPVAPALQQPVLSLVAPPPAKSSIELEEPPEESVEPITTPSVMREKPFAVALNDTFDAFHLPDVAPDVLPQVVNQSAQFSGAALPVLTQAQPGAPSVLSIANKRSLKRFASPPVRLSKSAVVQEQGEQAGLLILLDRLMGEKDDLQAKCEHLEKQKAHLQQANALFKHKVDALSDEIEALQRSLMQREDFKRVDNKAQLQKQLLALKKDYVKTTTALQEATQELEVLRDVVADKLNPHYFIGHWMEEAQLQKVAYDHFGMNIESHRRKAFKIDTVPTRCVGATAIIETQFAYEANALWKRCETLTLTLATPNRLEGELMVEYFLEDSPMAKAIYSVKCQRNGSR